MRVRCFVYWSLRRLALSCVALLLRSPRRLAFAIIAWRVCAAEIAVVAGSTLCGERSLRALAAVQRGISGLARAAFWPLLSSGSSARRERGRRLELCLLVS